MPEQRKKSWEDKNGFIIFEKLFKSKEGRRLYKKMVEKAESARKCREVRNRINPELLKGKCGI